MKKNKGFTLIELLAVIVILAIIALIATPIITGQLDQVRASAFLRSANSIVHAAELKYANLNTDTSSIATSYKVNYAEGVLVGSNTIDFKGKRPDEGLVTINTIGQVAIILWNDNVNKCVTKSFVEDSPSFNETVTTKEECQTLISGFVPISYPQVTDANPGVICGVTATEDYAGQTICDINSVEDLAQFSKLSQTQTFTSKTINLNVNLDIKSNKSYINPLTTVLGDINGNTTIEGLKVELTTGNGLKPIGNSSFGLAGTFNGNGNYINNVTIVGTDNVGLFGYTAGAPIKNLQLDHLIVSGTNFIGGLVGRGQSDMSAISISNATITGTGNYVGGIAGYLNSYNQIKDVIVSANVTGVTYVGGIAGYLYAGFPAWINLSSTIFEGNIVGNNYVGGIIGDKNDAQVTLTSTINKGGTIVGATNVGRIIGSTQSITNNIALNTILVNGATTPSTDFNGQNGYDVTANMLNDINAYEGIVDTAIGGDNNTNGYYFDYNSVGKIVLTPATSFTLAGAGTVGDPYLINTTAELRQVSLRLSSYFKLVNDLDFTDLKAYMLSSSANQFTGNFDGNNKKISNYSIIGVQNLGLFGYTTGAPIKNLLLDHFTISGISFVGSLVGRGQSDMSAISISNATITGTGNFVGGIAGYLNSYNQIKDVIVSANVTGVTYVGGIVGYLNASFPAWINLSSAIFEGNVVGNNYVGGIIGNKNDAQVTLTGTVNKGGTITGTTNVGRIIGSAEPVTNNIALNTILVNGATTPSSSFTSQNGYDVTAATLNDINAYEGIVDTAIGGDNNTNGYYFDYDNTGKIVITPAASFTLTGAGTVGDPYLINTTDDLKQVSLRLTSYFKLVNDLNFAGKKAYMLSSSTSQFNGNFDGNNKTISNYTINGVQYVGLFGYTVGATMKNLNLNGITVTGEGSFIGGLLGFSRSIATGIKITNANINGRAYTGGFAGYLNYYTMSYIMVTGNVTGTTYVGGIAGMMYASFPSCVYLDNAVFEGNVTGADNVGGIAGSRDPAQAAVTSVVNKSGSITGTTNAGRITGTNTPSNAIALNTILVNGATASPTGLTTINGRNNTAAELALQATYTGIGFNFTNTLPGTYAWQISGSNLWFVAN